MAEAKFLLAYVGRRYLIFDAKIQHLFHSANFFIIYFENRQDGVIRILICYGMLINVKWYVNKC